MKYRVIMGSSDVSPYIVQRKDEKAFFSFWRKVGQVSNEFDAKRLMQSSVARHAKLKVGTIIATYDEMDLVADRLKNESTMDQAATTGEYNKPAPSKSPNEVLNMLRKKTEPAGLR